jgi:hypothetical protein
MIAEAASSVRRGGGARSRCRGRAQRGRRLPEDAGGRALPAGAGGPHVGRASSILDAARRGHQVARRAGDHLRDTPTISRSRPPAFPSNWELSAARAAGVARIMIGAGQSAASRPGGVVRRVRPGRGQRDRGGAGEEPPGGAVLLARGRSARRWTPGRRGASRWWRGRPRAAPRRTPRSILPSSRRRRRSIHGAFAGSTRASASSASSSVARNPWWRLWKPVSGTTTMPVAPMR